MVFRSKKKGFSLFTPLIGTTVLVIAIMVSALMTSNDVKISHAITSSYEQSNQNFDAELIKAEASIGAFNLFNKFNRDELPTLSFNEVCTSTSHCKKLLKEDYRLSLNNYLLSNFYSEVKNAINTNSNYHFTRRYCPVEGVVANAKNCISTALGKAKQLFTLQQSGDNYKIKFKLVPKTGVGGVSPKKLNDSFIVEFTSSYQGNIALSILPRGFTYLTTNGIAGKFSKMAEIHHAFAKADVSGNTCYSKSFSWCLNHLNIPSDVDKIQVFEDSGGRIQTIFTWDSGFKVILRENGFSATSLPPEKCEWSNGGVVPSSIMSPLTGYDCSATI